MALQFARHIKHDAGRLVERGDRPAWSDIWATAEQPGSAGCGAARRVGAAWDDFDLTAPPHACHYCHRGLKDDQTVAELGQEALHRCFGIFAREA
jgi:hypothetical protein